LLRPGLGVDGCEQAGAYLRRMRMARPMTATMSWPMLTSRLARAMCDGLLVPSHRFRKSANSKSLAGIKARCFASG
jgi:hypothetical protein